MKINKDNLKIKFILGTFRNEDTYPTIEDLMYEVINFCYLNNRNIISNKDLEKIFEMDNVSNILNILQKENFLLLDKELKTKTNYKILKNPFE